MATSNASNIKTQGVVYCDGLGSFSGIDAASSGFVLKSSGTGVSPSFQSSSAVSGQSIPVRLTYITSTSGTGVSPNINFTSLSSSYSGYRFYIGPLTFSSSAGLVLQISTNNGSSFLTSTYVSSAIELNISTWVNFTSSARFLMMTSSGVSSSHLGGVVDVMFNNRTDFLTTIASRYSVTSSRGYSSTGYSTTQTAVDAVRFSAFGGQNINSGTIYQFGIN